jgi:hypothetical protein
MLYDPEAAQCALVMSCEGRLSAKSALNPLASMVRGTFCLYVKKTAVWFYGVF